MTNCRGVHVVPFLELLFQGDRGQDDARVHLRAIPEKKQHPPRASVYIFFYWRGCNEKFNSVRGGVQKKLHSLGGRG